MVRATIIGSGPNGLASAVSLARAGYEVRVLEASDTIGGGVRTTDGILPGFRHDVCSAVHPAALASPFFRAFGLADRIDWIRPEISYAHPLDGGRAAIAWRDIEKTSAALGADRDAWLARLRPLSEHIDGNGPLVAGDLQATQQLLATERHIAAGQMFCFYISKHHMDRSTG